ncbi:helix-turn-helix transcriptional regulator [Amycolatopsis thermophila]|uniref:ArsR family transcriptional regulator n=1 Tax=Amycolatopsis thermophila TaxID=206084 RepID=A0ABU0F2J2_9PSEU|nr:helix-turn-helix domain-containing protein [Amycolatopsis thermophila]MDQ0381795.1 putative ArsR family transcriptional regulator [Amycolatopsis thermophila]
MTQRREQVLRAVREAGPVGVAELARQVGLHPNSVRFHLDQLVADELVERVPGRASGPGRPPAEYRVPPGTARGRDRRYEALAEVLLGGPGDPAAAGVAWGRRLADRPGTAGEVVGLLDELGFAPEPAAEPHRIRLRHCPFLELAARHRDAVCSVHRGMVSGALEGGPLRARALLPFAEPDACVVELEDVRD